MLVGFISLVLRHDFLVGRGPRLKTADLSHRQIYVEDFDICTLNVNQEHEDREEGRYNLHLQFKNFKILNKISYFFARPLNFFHPD